MDAYRFRSKADRRLMAGRVRWQITTLFNTVEIMQRVRNPEDAEREQLSRAALAESADRWPEVTERARQLDAEHVAIPHLFKFDQFAKNCGFSEAMEGYEATHQRWGGYRDLIRCELVNEVCRNKVFLDHALPNASERHWYSDPAGMAAKAEALEIDDPTQFDIVEQQRIVMLFDLVDRFMTLVDFAFERAEIGMQQAQLQAA